MRKDLSNEILLFFQFYIFLKIPYIPIYTEFRQYEGNLVVFLTLDFLTSHLLHLFL